VRVRRQIQGTDSIASALDRSEPLQRIVVREPVADADVAALMRRAEAAGVAVQRVTHRHFRRLLADDGDCDAIGLVGPELGASARSVLAGDGATWQLVGVAYPGNAGAALRTAEVSGAAGAFVSTNFDRNSRRAALRASMRADRFLPIFFDAAAPVFDEARRQRRLVVAVENTGDRAPWDVDLRGRVHFVVGGEVDGIPADLLARCDQVVRLPMPGFLPSYNLQSAVAAVATERLRQLARVGE
jgi:TrmH family RNA methyltransferase